MPKAFTLCSTKDANSKSEVMNKKAWIFISFLMLSPTCRFQAQNCQGYSLLQAVGFYIPLQAISSYVKDVKLNTSRQKSPEEAIVHLG